MATRRRFSKVFKRQVVCIRAVRNVVRNPTETLLAIIGQYFVVYHVAVGKKDSYSARGTQTCLGDGTRRGDRLREDLCQGWKNAAIEVS